MTVPPVAVNVAVTLRRPSRVRIAWIDSLGPRLTISLVADQDYGSQELDAAVLMIPIVRFLPGTDERVTGTIDALRRELGHDGFISRYSTTATDDGLPGSEAQFLACSFWLVRALAMNERTDEAQELFERPLSLGNEVGLFSEEYDVAHQRLVGNFPQAFTHLTLVAAAKTLPNATADVAGRYTDPPPAQQVHR